jgi:hypothetical protein
MMTGKDGRLSEFGIVHQAELTQTVEHGLANVFRNSAPPQGIGQFHPASRPCSKQSQANTLRVRRWTDGIATLDLLHGRPVGRRAAFMHGISGASPCGPVW